MIPEEEREKEYGGRIWRKKVSKLYIEDPKGYVDHATLYSFGNNSGYYVIVTFNEDPIGYGEYSIHESEGYMFTFDPENEVLIGLEGEWDDYVYLIGSFNRKTFQITYIDIVNSVKIEGYGNHEPFVNLWRNNE